MNVIISKQSDGFDLIEIVSRKGSALTLSQYGAGMYSFLIDGIQMLASPLDYSSYADSKSYYGKFIGPIAGRVGEGKIEVGGEDCVLPINESPNSLHSGSLCYAFYPFDYRIEETPQTTRVIFKRKFPASPGQFNANIDACIAYTLEEENDRITIVMSAIPDVDAPINLTSHLYFCLGQESVYPDTLTIRVKSVARYREGMLLKSFAEPCKALDFTSGKTVGEDILSPLLADVGGLDHAFLLEKGEGPMARLTGKDYVLEAFTDAPCFQVYATNYPIRDQRMLLGNLDQKGSGITFEPVGRMDGSLLCPKGIGQTRKVIYSFKRKGAKS